MAYIVKKKVKGKDYYFVVRGKRTGKKVTYEYLYSIGDKEALLQLYESIKKRLKKD